MSPRTSLPTRLDALGSGPPPEAVALALARAGAPGLAWLDSALAGPDGRWSVLAAWPDLALDTRPGDPDPLPETARLLAATPETPGPMPSAHLLLALGYDLGARLDRFPWKAKDDLAEHDLRLRRYPAILVHDGEDGSWWLSALDEPARRLGASRFHVALEEAREEEPLPAPVPAGDPERNLPKAAYLAAVAEIRRLIREGEVYQVNLAQRFRVPTSEAPLTVYRRLRRVTPAPYGAFLDWGGPAVLSASPELYLSLEGRQVRTRPIKGTRPRAQDPAEDRRLRAELEASPKDRAELAMIVDLERNDLGRVAVPGSVAVAQARTLSTLSTVHHAAAEVTATLREGLGLVDLIRAAFPGGSVTGCPRLRAMEVLDALEPTRRGIYCGALGWASASRACLNLPIRTLTLGGGTATLHAGGGIVIDSDPEAEHRETLAKARGMLEALGATVPPG